MKLTYSFCIQKNRRQSQLTIFAVTPPAPVAPRSKYLTLATRITALTIAVETMRSPLTFLLMRTLVIVGCIPSGVFIKVLMCLKFNKV